MTTEDQEVDKQHSNTHIHQEVRTNEGNIIGQFLNRPNIFIQPSVSTEIIRPKNEQVLLKLVKEEISSRLHQSLHNQIFLQLEKEIRPKSVKRLWDAEIKIGLKDSEPVSNNIQVVDLFNRNDINGKLLILGEPGSGKTTTVLKLANALINSKVESHPNYPIPVLFSLVSWKPRYSIMEWLISELNSKYGVRKDTANNWIAERRLLPILDALDELSISYQLNCVHALNKFLLGEHSPLYLVVCSRNEEYEKLDTQLQLNSAIYLKELTEQQIHSYLTQINQSRLWEKLTENSKLLKLVKVPFLLSIYTLAYQDICPAQMQSSKITKEDLAYMLDFYIKRMMEREISSHPSKLRKPPSAMQTRLWLITLAQQLERESQTEFLIENIGPTWLHTKKSRWFYLLGKGCLLMLTCGLVGALAAGIIAGFKESLYTWLNLWSGISPDLNSRLIGGFLGGAAIGMMITVLPDHYLKPQNTRLKYTFRDPLNGIVARLVTYRFLDSSKPNRKVAEEVWNKLFNKENRRKSHRQAYRNIKKKAHEKYGESEEALELYKEHWIENFEKRSKVADSYLRYFILFLPLSGLSVFFFWGTSYFIVFGSAFLFLVFLNGLQIVQIDENIFSNEAIWKSLKNSILGAVLGAVVGGILAAPIVHGGIVGGLFLGGLACVQHFTARLILYVKGSLPWNYTYFLDCCTEQLLIQKIGGRYRFMHKLLQEHFAAMPFNQTYPKD